MQDQVDKPVMIFFRVTERMRRKAKSKAAREGTSLQMVLHDFLTVWLTKKKAA